jgi:hypothetical protein
MSRKMELSTKARGEVQAVQHGAMINLLYTILSHVSLCWTELLDQLLAEFVFNRELKC